MKKLIYEYVPQVILIVFSVVLGLYLNQKMVERTERQDAAKILNIIKSEVLGNQKILKDWGAYHQEIKFNFDSLVREEKFVEEFIANKEILFGKLFTRKTFMQESLSKSAWEISKNNPVISKIDYDKMLWLDKIYNQQKIAFEPAMEMFELYYSTGVNDVSVAAENLKIMSKFMSECAGREGLLFNYYNDFLEHLDSSENKKISDKSEKEE